MMTDVRTIQPHKYNARLAEELKKLQEFKQQEWSLLVKTSVHRKRPSTEEDFWHKRAASILRQIYVNGVVGVERLRTRYGGKKQRGQRPPEYRKGGGKIIRVILQQAESYGLVEKVKEKKSGRKLTKEGTEFMEKLAGDLK